MFSEFCALIAELCMNCSNANTPKKVNGGNKIFITGNQYCNVILFHPRILQHCSSNERVNTLFFCSDHAAATLRTNLNFLMAADANRTF